MKIKWLLTLSISALVSFSSTPVFSQETAKDSTQVEEIEENLDEENASDSSAQGTVLMPFDVNSVPGSKVYSCWNNDIVNPYKINLTKMPDTLLLDLTGYAHPICGRITSDFGWRRSRWHYGTDIKLQVGDSLHSTFDGMVRIAKRSRTFGNYIVIRHNNGLETIYGHLSKILVNINQRVKAGEVIGLGGNTGRSTGPHLHYEVRYLGNNINPHEIIDFQNLTALGPNLSLCQKNFEYLIEINKIRYHVVRNGDTLYKISRKYGVSIKTLCKLNRISKGRLIRIGQRIRYT